MLPFGPEKELERPSAKTFAALTGFSQQDTAITDLSAQTEYLRDHKRVNRQAFSWC